jgi:hypothetical protein
LNDIHDLAVALEDVDELGGFAVPDEDVAGVAAADDVLVLQAEVVYVLDGFDVAV